MTKNSYNFKAFNDVMNKINNFIEQEGLDRSKCTINITDGVDGDISLICYDNVNQRMFGAGLSKVSILSPNYKQLAEDVIMCA